MAGRRKSEFYNTIFKNVEITDFAAEGKALCRVDNLVVFVNHAAPGDVADIKVVKAKRNYLEANIVKIHKSSPMREQAFCEHFGVCGGCKWQHLKYQQQLEFKQQQVIDNIERIGKVPKSEFRIIPIAGSQQVTYYRNKLEYSFTNRRWLTNEEIKLENENIEKNGLGFHVPGFFDKVMNINKCYLQPEPSNQIRLWLKEYAIKNNLVFFDIRQNTGWLRNVVIRNNIEGSFQVNLVISKNENTEQLYSLLENLNKEFPQITSLFYTVNSKKNSSINDLEPVLYKGKPYLEEKMDNIKFSIGPNSFFQTNSKQAFVLYSIARDFAGLTTKETVYDLYTGAGTIACFIASNAKKIIGVEYVEEAVNHAKENAAVNNIHNAEFYCGDMAKILTEDFIVKNGRPDVIITDPPRAGMHPDVIEQINKSGAKRIVYVSCNPATQARDIAMLNTAYKLEKIQAVDMFPHTQHVESVAQLILRK